MCTLFFVFVLLVLRSPSPKNRIGGPKTAKFFIEICCFSHFWPNIGLSGPVGAMPDQKTIQTSCLGGYLIYGCQNICSLSKELGCLAQNGHFGLKIYIFGHFWANIGLALGWLFVGCGARAALRTKRLPTLELS